MIWNIHAPALTVTSGFMSGVLLFFMYFHACFYLFLLVVVYLWMWFCHFATWSSVAANSIALSGLVVIYCLACTCLFVCLSFIVKPIHAYNCKIKWQISVWCRTFRHVTLLHSTLCRNYCFVNSACNCCFSSCANKCNAMHLWTAGMSLHHVNWYIPLSFTSHLHLLFCAQSNLYSTFVLNFFHFTLCMISYWFE